MGHIPRRFKGGTTRPPLKFTPEESLRLKTLEAEVKILHGQLGLKKKELTEFLVGIGKSQGMEKYVSALAREVIDALTWK